MANPSTRTPDRHSPSSASAMCCRRRYSATTSSPSSTGSSRSASPGGSWWPTVSSPASRGDVDGSQTRGSSGQHSTRWASREIERSSSATVRVTWPSPTAPASTAPLSIGTLPRSTTTIPPTDSTTSRRSSGSSTADSSEWVGEVLTGDGVASGD